MSLSDDQLAIRADWYLRRGEIGVYTPRPLAMRVAGLRGDEAKLSQLDVDLGAATLLGHSQKKRGMDSPFAERWSHAESALAQAAEAYRAWRDHLRAYFDAERKPPKRVPAQIVVELLGKGSTLARVGWALFTPDPPLTAHNPYTLSRASLATGLFEPYLALAELLYLELPLELGEQAPYRGSFARKGHADAMLLLARASEKLGLALDPVATVGEPLSALAGGLPATVIGRLGETNAAPAVVRRITQHRFVAAENTALGVTALHVELGPAIGEVLPVVPAAVPAPVTAAITAAIPAAEPAPLRAVVFDPAETAPVPPPPKRVRRAPRVALLPEPSVRISVHELQAAAPMKPRVELVPAADSSADPAADPADAATMPPLRVVANDPLLQWVVVMRASPGLNADLEVLTSGASRPVMFGLRNDLARSRYLQTTVDGPGLGYLTAWEALHAAVESRRDEVDTLLGALNGHPPLDAGVRERLLAALPSPRDPDRVALVTFREWLVDQVIADWIRLRQLLDEALPVEVPGVDATPAGDTERVVHRFVSAYGRAYVHLPLYGLAVDELPAISHQKRFVSATELLDCDRPPSGVAPGRLCRVPSPSLAGDNDTVVEFIQG